MKKTRLLFVINQFFKGGAETAMLNLFRSLSPEEYGVDLLVFDDADIPGTISLIPELPEHIRVIRGRRAGGRRLRRLTGAPIFPRWAVNYVRSHEYDAAFSCGEWFSSSLVGREARAALKYVWIHADIDKAGFLHPDILTNRHMFDGFLFVSEHSRQAALSRFPELTHRSAVVHNTVDTASILQKSKQPLSAALPKDGLPLLVTVANLRPEKNHLRQLHVMARLRRQGLDFHWLNIGSPASPSLAAELEATRRDLGLEDRFHLLGAMENPYPLMAAADGVCVLSDHESWSMVITEAKALGLPVVATKTSGALAQLADGETGLLCDFDEASIADAIRRLLTEPELGHRFRANLAGFSPQTETLGQLRPLLSPPGKKVLFVFDDINYVSGARNAALRQAAALEQRSRVTLFSSEPCRDRQLKAAYDLVDHSFDCLLRPTREVLRDPRVSPGQKLRRFICAVANRLGLGLSWGQSSFTRELTEFMEGFDAVCVVSEASRFREIVSRLHHPRKIQWIHTDYAAWKDLTHWTRDITARDGELYRSYDAVVCLSPRLRDKFSALYPHLADKAVVIPNPVDVEGIRARAEEPCGYAVESSRLNLITVGRMETEKRYDRLLAIAAELREKTDFHWYFVGGGRLLEDMKALCRDMGLNGHITFTGNLENPYPLMRQCDCFVLLSEYEGTPVTVDEAKALGLPVLANDVGGIADMLEDGKYGSVLTAGHSPCEAILSLRDHSASKAIALDFSNYNQAIQQQLYRLADV